MSFSWVLGGVALGALARKRIVDRRGEAVGSYYVWTRRLVRSSHQRDQ